MSMYSVGDRVLINEYGHDNYGESLTNPRDCFGTVISMGIDKNWVNVKWDNGQKNYYLKETLSLALPASLENI